MTANIYGNGKSSRKNKKIKIMEVCGTHTMVIAKYGLRDYFAGIELISGPGCPVCVTSSCRLEQCVGLSKNKNIIITAFGDMLRVPAFTSSLEKEMYAGADIRVIYSVYDSLKIALKNPEKEIVFIGAGFETTAPLAAAVVLEARREKIKNFSLLSMFKSVFPALYSLTNSEGFAVDGFILPGNVASITGAADFRFLTDKYKIPCAIAGFLKDDIVKAVDFLAEAAKRKAAAFENIYKTAVSENGNVKAKEILSAIFDLKDDVWRGFGKIKKSGFRLKEKYCAFDADKKFKIKPVKEKKDACRCGDIMKGKINPYRCVLFAKKCTPLNPYGPCMVSSEGVCSAYYKYR
jgi:hydrogenase expression/formation protein HypD